VDFVLANTRLAAVPSVPEIRLHLAEEPFGLWEKTERKLGGTGLPLPFWAFAWAGGVALARYVLDHPDVVAGRSVLDLASGSGLVAIAAAKAGAATVTANEVDGFARAAIALNVEANGVAVAGTFEDVLDGDGAGAEVVLAGDVFYERPMAERVRPFLERAWTRGAHVLVGDLGRAYLPSSGFEAIASYDVPVTRALEDAEVKRTTVWRPARA
jgi:predicted nicotinamide N-methyase